MRSRARQTRNPVGVGQRLGIVARWPIGLVLITWRYLWRTTPVRRLDEEGDASDLPRPLPAALDADDVQGVDDGYGALLHRRYSVRVEDGRLTPERAITLLAHDPNAACPRDVAVFVKLRDEGDEMEVGDEYVVRMPGPWNGPVRVVARTPTSFRLATLSGHLEAGEIEFRAHCEGDEFVFEIESWARPGDRLSHVLYNRLLLAKEIQLNLWVETCLGVARMTGGRLRGGARVHTRRVADPEHPPPVRVLPGHPG